MTISDMTRYRLENQRIAPATANTPEEIVAHLGAMQAQDHPGAKWSIGLRLKDGSEADIDKAIADRKIVRTWPMRGTLHFLAGDDIRWMLKLMAPRVLAGSKTRSQQLGLDEAIFAKSRDIFTKTLSGGKQLTRDEMQQNLQQAGISTDGQRGYHILWRTAQEGLICFASHAGKQPTFALLDEWLPTTKHLDRDEALAELAKRYFTSHGPATIQDLAWWSGLTLTDVRAGLEAIKQTLVSETMEGKTYWWVLGEPPLEKSTPNLYLLPGFDEYMLGYKDRAAIMDSEHASKIVPGNNGMFMPTIVRDGRVVGIWKRTLKKQTFTVSMQLFADSGESAKPDIVAAAERYGRYLGLSLSDIIYERI